MAYNLWVTVKASPTKKLNKADGMIKRTILFSILISLYFNTNLQDPFNSPKMWILMCISGWLLPYVISTKSIRSFSFRGNTSNWANSLIILFLVFLLISSLMTEVKFTAFFGVEGRRLGFITYFCLGILMLFFIKFYEYEKTKIYYPILALSTVFVGYGYLQGIGQDFVNWNNPYNSIILTFGNPNFASAMLSIFAAILVGASIDRSVKIQVRAVMVLVAFCMIIVIRNSNSRQGLIAFSIAILIQACFVLYFKKKILGQIALAFAGIIFSLIVLAMAQIGPLVDLVYKQSVSIRGYYWRAAIEMFRDNPIFGVGIDRYGEYFKEYREVSYSLTYGFEITSSNAHSVPLQLLATGGTFVGLTYLLLTIYIFFAGIRAIMLVKSEHRGQMIAVFSGWIAFQAQSVISIDNIGLTIWGWILGGIIIASYQKVKGLDGATGVNNRVDSSLTATLTRQLISYLLIFAVIILCSFPYRGEVLALKTRSTYNPSFESNRALTADYGQQMEKLSLVEPNHRFWSANYLITSGFEELGFKVLNDLIVYDPRNLNYLNAMAGYLEQKKQFGDAIKFRMEIEKYDPWNAQNILALGKNYKSIGNFPAAQEARLRILSFASSLPIVEESKALLTND